MVQRRTGHQKGIIGTKGTPLGGAKILDQGIVRGGQHEWKGFNSQEAFDSKPVALDFSLLFALWYVGCGAIDDDI